jgi:ATP-dependent RNA helicase DDX56/DBP9
MPPGWDSLSLDARLLRALAKRGFTAPTPVQLAAVPATLNGHDVVARARTGSGKTLAYLLPTFQRLLASEQPATSFKAIILVPTRELCVQVHAAGCSVRAAAPAAVPRAGAAAADRDYLSRCPSACRHFQEPLHYCSLVA